MEMVNPIQTRQMPLGRWVPTLYFALCFYYFGAIMLTYVVRYPGLAQVHEHFAEFMASFNSRMIWGCYVPAGLLVLAAASLLRIGPAAWPRWAGWASVGLAGASVAGTLLVLVPLYHDLAATGCTPDKLRHLAAMTRVVQLAPAGLLVPLALGQLNGWLHDTRLVARWVFIGIFATAYYGMGATCVEAFVNYPGWLTVGPADWLAFRTASQAHFFPVFLLPTFIPTLLLVPFFWVRPQGIPLWSVAAYALGFGWIAYITATYFVPHVQLPLWKTGYSASLIKELMRNDLLWRDSVGVLLWALPAWMLVRAVGGRAVAPATTRLPSAGLAPTAG